MATRHAILAEWQAKSGAAAALQGLTPDPKAQARKRVARLNEAEEAPYMWRRSST